MKKNNKQGYSRYDYLRIGLFFVALLIVIILGVKFNLNSSQHIADIQLLSGVVALFFLYPTYKAIHYFENKSKEKKK